MAGCLASWGRLMVVFALFGGVAASFAPVPASAEAACRAECGALYADLAQDPPPVRTCVARCEVRRATLGARGPTGTTAMPNPATPWTRVAANARPPAHANPGGRGTATYGTAPAPVPLTVASAAPPAAPGGFIASIMGAQAATAAPAPAAVARPPAAQGAIYLAAAPSRAFGLAVGQGDSGSAHREAGAACRASRGAGCAVAAEFTARCAAVAHGMRNNGGLVITAHPSTHTITGASFGTGETRAEAERMAMAGCTSRARGGECRLTEARCAGG